MIGSDRIGSDWIGLVGIHRKRKEVAVDVPSADKESAIRRAESTDADGNGHEKCQSSQSSTSERLQPQRESINTLKDSSSLCHSSTTRQSVQSISSMLVEAPSSLNQSINQSMELSTLQSQPIQQQQHRRQQQQHGQQQQQVSIMPIKARETKRQRERKRERVGGRAAGKREDKSTFFHSEMCCFNCLQACGCTS